MKRSEFTDMVINASEQIDTLIGSFEELRIKARPVNGEIIAYLHVASDALRNAESALDELDAQISGENS